VHDAATVNAGKLGAGEHFLPRPQRAPHEETFARAQVDVGVVFVGDDRADLRQRNEARGRVSLDENGVAHGERRRAGRCGDWGDAGVGPSDGLQTRERSGEAFRRHGLEQVVERIDLESAEGVLVEGRHKNDPCARADVGHEIEAVASPELDVEQHQIVIGGREPRARVLEGARFADEREWRRSLDELAEVAAREGFVVDDEGGERL
jgi:hypothetical protein